MQTLAAPDVFLFFGFSLDRRRGGLFKRSDQGTESPIALGSRALDILSLLVERSGELVTKDEINAAVWRGALVEDSNLTVHIAALRRVLDKDRAQGSCIQTVVGRGYRFVAEVTYPAAERRFAAARLSLTASISQPTVAPYLSLVVLPFKNFSHRPDEQCFAERIADDLTTDMSRFTGMRVISRSTASTYRNRPVAAKQIGRELGVRYVLEGSVHPSANHVRVNVQLIDAETDAHLWVERFDRDAGDLFGVQNEITQRAAVSLYQTLIGVEALWPTEDPDAYKYILQGRAAKVRPLNHDVYTEAIDLFERALALDPHSGEAQGWLAETLAQRVLDEMADAAAPDVARAAGLATRALTASPRSAFSHLAKARVLCAQGRYKEAIPEYETASTINPGFPHLYGCLSDCKFWIGSIEDAIPLAEQAIAISLRDALGASWYFSIGRVHLVRSRIKEALAWLEKTCSANSEFPTIHAWLASAYALNGETERAAAELAQARVLNRDGRYSSISRVKELGCFGVPKVGAMLETTYFAGLRKAGMPEE